MKFEWDDKKNELLKNSRGIGFENVVEAVLNDKILDDIENESRKDKQRMLIVEICDYVYVVPYEKRNKTIRLITIFPSRKMHKIYKKEL
jgi:uncharacterized DUF497 family protein